ncbi:MAG TPA: DUF6249 domain-containing protein [Chthoniobacterales bacterium]|jgi:hypothetical protein|nr:DUF6249 domain-containing protein [Chthoniobacterales bacterium]
MKTTILTSCCSLLLVLTTFGQTPAPALPPATAPAATITPSVPPVAIATPTVAPVATAIPSATPAISPSSTPDIDDQIDNAVEQKIRKHFDFSSDRHHSDDDSAWIALPIVFIVFLTIFGTPVMIVALILYFSFSRSRAMHKTVRMMVEKGQPVPEALLNPPPVVRQRSDLRRGVTWLLVGLGMMIFFGACSEWDGGAWSLGIIPFLIGAGYLIFWRLDIRKDDTSPKV